MMPPAPARAEAVRADPSRADAVRHEAGQQEAGQQETGQQETGQQETGQQETGQQENGQQETAASWRALGTLVRLVVTDSRCLAEARSMLRQDLAAVDLACSRFRADSEICALRGGHTQQVSPLLAEAIAVALRAAELTEGDVDPTVGAAMSAIGYDRDFEQIPPTGPALAVTVAAVPGWHEVHLDGWTLSMPEGVRLDLGATAKAWAADRSAMRIASRVGCGVLVSLGGDIAVAGPAPDGGWRIRVQDVTGSPDDPPDGPYALIAIRDGGLATSSTAARRWRRGGDVLHHILDPRTGLPADSGWRTVSVAAGTCADANAASTAAIIRGRRALGWLASLGLPARLVDTTGAVFTVAGWPQDTQDAQGTQDSQDTQDTQYPREAQAPRTPRARTQSELRTGFQASPSAAMQHGRSEGHRDTTGRESLT